MSPSLFAWEFRGWSQLERGGGCLGSRSIDEVGEDLSLFEEEVKPLDSVCYLCGGSGSSGWWCAPFGITSFWSYSPAGSVASGLVRFEAEVRLWCACCWAAASSGGT